MAISQVSQTQSSSTQTGATQSLAYPANIQAGDLIIVVSTQDGGADGFTKHPDYTEIFQNFGTGVNDTTGYHAHMTQAKVAVGNESGTNFSWTHGASATEETSHQIRVYRGVKLDGFEMVWRPAPGDQAADATQPTGALTHSAGVQNEILFFTSSTGDAGAHTSPPSGFTALLQRSATGIRIGSAHNIATNTDTQAASAWISSAGDRYYNCVVGFLIAADPPVTPTGFAAEDVELSAKISWNDDGDADSWIIEEAPDSGGSPGSWAEVYNTSSYTSPWYTLGQEAGISKWYRMKARNAGGDSGYTTQTKVDFSSVGGDSIFMGSTPIPAGKLKLGSTDIAGVFLGANKIWPLGGALPTAPVLSSQLVNSDEDVQLDWTAATYTGEAMDYVIYRSSTGGAPWTKIYQGPSNVLTYTDVAPGSGTWTYYVVGLGTAGEGAASNTVSETIVIPAPGVPTSLAAVWNTPNVDVSWAAPASGGPVSTYNVYRGLSAGSLSQVASGIAGTSWQDTTIVTEDTYYYSVEAVGAGGTGSQATPVSVDVSFASGNVTLVASVLQGHSSIDTELDLPALPGGQSGDKVYIIVGSEDNSSGLGFDNGGWVQDHFLGNSRNEIVVYKKDWDSSFNSSQTLTGGNASGEKVTSCILLRGLDETKTVYTNGTSQSFSQSSPYTLTNQSGQPVDTWSHHSVCVYNMDNDLDIYPSGFPTSTGVQRGSDTSTAHATVMNRPSVTGSPTGSQQYGIYGIGSGNATGLIIGLRGV